MKTELCKLYSTVFCIFLPNVIKIDPYNFELYGKANRFKLVRFLTHGILVDSTEIKLFVRTLRVRGVYI